MLGTQELTVDSWSDTSIVTSLMVTEAGDLELKVGASDGNAVDTLVSNI